VKNCKKYFRLAYVGEVFDMMKRKQVGGNYPVGGEIIAKVDRELWNMLNNFFDVSDIDIGDCVEMNNGWSLGD